MEDSLRLGRVAGIRVGMHWSVVGMGLLVAAVLALQVLPAAFPGYGWADRWGAALGGTVLFGLSLLAHELGHAVLARRHGVGVDGITLWLLGGVARLERQAPNPAAELRIAAAGPLVSGLLGLVLVGATVLTRGLDQAPLARAVVLWVGLVNVVLALFNLLPGAPLDGGRVLSALIWRRVGDAERARLLAGRAGLVLGAVLTTVGAVEIFGFGRLAGWGTAAIGLFVASAARGEVAGAFVRGRLHHATVGEVMVAHPPDVPDWVTLDRFERWSHQAGRPAVFPVVRWDHRPIGWVASDRARGPAPVERSWVRVSQIMVPDRQAPRAWSSEPVDVVLARLQDDLPEVVVVLDPRTGSVCGTVGRWQVAGLMAPPDLWGRQVAS